MPANVVNREEGHHRIQYGSTASGDRKHGDVRANLVNLTKLGRQPDDEARRPLPMQQDAANPERNLDGEHDTAG